jgi:hypothetical protein
VPVAQEVKVDFTPKELPEGSLPLKEWINLCDDLPAEYQNQENWNLYAKLNPKGFDMYYMPQEFMTVKLADIAVLKSSESYHNIRKLLPGFVSKKVMKFIIADIDNDEGYSADDLVAEHPGMFPEIEEALARRQARFDARNQEDAA